MELRINNSLKINGSVYFVCVKDSTNESQACIGFSIKLIDSDNISTCVTFIFFHRFHIIILRVITYKTTHK